MLNSPPVGPSCEAEPAPTVVLGPPPGTRSPGRPRRLGPPPTWSQYFAARRAARGSISPLTRWGYLVLLLASSVILSTSLIELPSGSGLLPAQTKTLWGHPAFAASFAGVALAVVLAVLAVGSRRPRSFSFGVHAAFLLAIGSVCSIVGFIDVARRVALLGDNDIGIGGGVITMGILGVCGLSLAAADVLQVPDLRRLQPLRYAAGYAWAPVLIAGVMLFRDTRINTSYAARAGALTEPVPGEAAEGAVRAGQLGFASSGLGYLLILAALVALFAAAAATWVRRPRRFAHIPAALVAGPLIVLAAVLVVLAVLRVLVVTAGPAGQIAARIDAAPADVHLNLGYGGWLLFVAAAGLMFLGTFVTQAGLATPRIAPYRPPQRRAPRAVPPQPAGPIGPPVFRPPPPPMRPMSVAPEPAARPGRRVGGTRLPDAQVAVGSTPIGAAVLGAAALAVGAPEPSSASGQYAAFPTPLTRRPD